MGLGDHEARVLEQAQVARDGRAADWQLVGDLLHRALAAVQQLHDGAALRVAEGLERVAVHASMVTSRLRSYLTLPTSWMWSASAAPPNGRVRPKRFNVASGTPSTPGVSEASPCVCGSSEKPPTSTECCGVR